ncbi:hypothetical protein [Microbacterium luteum]|uniref:hypothetical protein n=1 Tax=Microbacterium luteum TaxID=2782167 RepID=UPI001889B73C|nr:hypothetical protein [Microbacterium luteum]
MKALTQLERIARDIERRPELIAQAREEGATWEQIATALNMSRAGVIKLHNSR